MSEKHCSVCGTHVSAPLWSIGWLFTVGWLKLAFWKALLAIIIWPYYIGEALRSSSGH